MTDAYDITDDIEPLATVSDCHVHDEDGFAVVFSTNTVPETFQTKALEQGFAVSRIDDTDELTVVFKRITSF
jgi:hypothetical protein